MKLKLDLILLLAGIHTSAARCRRWLGKCTQNSDCCNNRRCMKWGRCSLVHQVLEPSKVYKCFENRDELIAGVGSYRNGNETEKEVVKEIYGNPIGTWCVGKVTDFESIFDVDAYAYVAGFNESISSWNTSSATNMWYMFYEQNDFNQDLSLWDVSKVTEMTAMFYKARSFNNSLSSWNVSKVTSFEGMFGGATSFNQDLSSWDVSAAMLMNKMFINATAFNRNLCEWRNKLTGPVNYERMFDYTSCPLAKDPEYDGTTIKNMCYSCV
jgi:surface protein